MSKKFVLIGFSLIILVGLMFGAAKLQPCRAQEDSCITRGKSAELSLVNKNVSISTYTKEATQAAFDSNKRVILFFQASWCSTCYKIEEDFQTHASQIPTDVVIYRVNIDTNKELTTSYNVVAPDEMVEINQNWETISHWKSSEHAVDELLRYLK